MYKIYLNDPSDDVNHFCIFLFFGFCLQKLQLITYYVIENKFEQLLNRETNLQILKICDN